MTGLYVASNTQALGAQITLQRNTAVLGEVLTRLSTGLKINSAKDDPAGLIASELLKSDITATKQAIQNTQMANSVIAVADSALGQVSVLLNDIRSLVNASANTGAVTDSQIAANQLQVDASIDSIDRIAKTTTFQGKKLLDGSMSFTTSGVDSSKVKNLDIQAANFGTADQVNVTATILEDAKKGTLIYNGTGVGQDTVIQVGGSQGSQLFSFGAGSTTKDMAEAINMYSDSTGVTARVEGEASRGNLTLSSVGANNDVVITANEDGFDAGNYTFRIVQGEVNDARIVSDPSAAKAGVVEISLEKSYTAKATNFVGTFDISLSTGGSAGTRSISINQGSSNKVSYNETATVASGTSADTKKTVQVTNAGAGGHMSNLNGWTIKVGEVGTALTYDDTAKVVTVAAVLAADGVTVDMATLETDVAAALERISGGNVYGTGGTPSAVTAFTGQAVLGDTFKLGGGAEAGELVITYKEGATADDILKMLNNTKGVQATLATGVDGKSLVKDVIQAPSRTSVNAVLDPYSSSVTAADMVALINSKLGDKFTATLKSGDLGTGLVTYQDASAISGSVNSDNAIRFTGMDNGPVVRMTSTDAKGNPIINQKLSVTLINPTDADIAAGRNTPILQINLATDASGAVTTTAADIVKLFNSLTPSQTGGVSAALVYPDGIDPNGRTWVADPCGGGEWVEGCGATYGLGLVDPTGVPGPCEIQQNDIVLLGANQTLAKGYAIARIPSAQPGFTAVAVPAAVPFSAGLTSVAAEAPDATWNGVTLVIKTLATGDTNIGKYDWDVTTGTLTAYADEEGTTAADIDALITGASGGTTTDGLNVADLVQAFTGHENPPTALTIATPGTMTGVSIAAAGGSASSTITGGIDAETPLPTHGMVTSAVTGAAISIKTDDFTSALNGVSFNFTTNANEEGFDETTGALTVYLAPETVALVDVATSANLATEITQAINGAIQSNWQGIRQFTKTTSGPVTVTATLQATDTVADLLDNFGSGVTDLVIPPSTGDVEYDAAIIDNTKSSRGYAIPDPALLIEANVAGPDMAGVQVLLVENKSLTPSTDAQATVNVKYDEKNKQLVIEAYSSNGAGIRADILAKALNDNATFKKYFNATSTINVGDNDDTGAAPTVTTARVAFNSDTATKAVTSGGYMIQTAENLNNASGQDTAISSGIAMTGNNDDNQRLVLEATEYGSQHYVDVNVYEGSFRTFCPLGYEMDHLAGKDASVNVNGQKAQTDGYNVNLSTASLQMSFSLDPTKMSAGDTTSFAITGGGAVFQLGPDVVSNQQIRVAIPNVSSATLGGASGRLYQLKSGYNADLSTDTKLADKIVQEAISSIAMTRGRLGAIQKSTLEPNQAVLEDTVEQLSAAEALITNADFAEESSRLTRAQILVQSGATVLSLANQIPQYAASLIR